LKRGRGSAKAGLIKTITVSEDPDGEAQEKKKGGGGALASVISENAKYESTSNLGVFCPKGVQAQESGAKFRYREKKTTEEIRPFTPASVEMRKPLRKKKTFEGAHTLGRSKPIFRRKGLNFLDEKITQ